MKLKLKKGDVVEVITGSDRGRSGEILEIDRNAMKVKVRGVKIITKNTKKDGQQKLEGFIDYSNIKKSATKRAPKTAAAKA